MVKVVKLNYSFRFRSKNEEGYNDRRYYFFITFVVRTFTYFTSGSVSQKDYAKELVKDELSSNPENDKYKIDVVPYGEQNIINTTVMGLPQDNTKRLEVDLQVNETTVNG